MDFVYESENFLTKEYCDHLIKKVKSEGNAVKGMTAGGFQPHIKLNDDVCLVHDQILWKSELDFMQDKSKEALNKYKKHLIDNKLYNQVESNHFFNGVRINAPQVQISRTDGFYRWHMDSALNGCRRIMAYIIYLNDMDEGSGGSTDFLGKSVKPKAGKLLMFPTTWTYLHRGKKVEKGTKYILAGFMYKDD
tara:strand:- start:825 stop:1400 length:576 start_codon:yes stop_codon:yes gene_type:complete